MDFTIIPNFSHYEVSPGGLLRNAKSKTVITPTKDGHYNLINDTGEHKVITPDEITHLMAEKSAQPDTAKDPKKEAKKEVAKIAKVKSATKEHPFKIGDKVAFNLDDGTTVKHGKIVAFRTSKRSGRVSAKLLHEDGVETCKRSIEKIILV